MSNKFAFVGEWFQEEAQVIRTFTIFYYPIEKCIEIYWHNTRKAFLKKILIETVQLKDFFIGSKINVFGRQIDIINYANEATRRALGESLQKVFVLVKSSILQRVGEVLDAFTKSDFSIQKSIMLLLNDSSARKIFGSKGRGDIEITILINEMVANPVVGFEMVANNGQEKLISSLAAATGSKEGLKHVSLNLQELFQNEDMRNGIYFAKTEEDSISQAAHFFNSENNIFNTVKLHDTTLAIIKPHAIKEGLSGQIITDIVNSGFHITAIKMILLERINCEEFYEIYRGVLNEYMQMVGQLASGPCLALELKCTDSTKNSHEVFRMFCGPMDPEIAKSLRPNTLRAKYGRNKILNALHCTDLPEDATLEIEYFFKILE